MEIKWCKRCGESWCFRGDGNPLRCGKCKSPYWDRERVNANRTNQGGGRDGSVVYSEGRGIDSGDQNRGREIPSVRQQEVGSISPSQSGFDEMLGGDEEAIGEPDKPLCGFESWNEQDGENYRCMLPAHGPKVKHGCWRKI